jgi:hypothetical protein
MGVWSQDIIGGDSAIEFAMDVLRLCGVGPPIQLGAKVCMIPVGCKVFICRHTVDEYDTYFEHLRTACSQSTALEKHVRPVSVLHGHDLITATPFTGHSSAGAR